MKKSICAAIKSNKNIPPNEVDYLQEIYLAMEGIQAVYKTCSAENNIEAQFVILKAIAIEIHKVWQLSQYVSISNKLVTKHYEKKALISMRNAICHIDQHVKGRVKATHSKSRDLTWETKQIADGLAKSSDGGKSWETHNVKIVFNFRFSGNKGASTTVGLLDRYLVCQSELGALNLNLDSKIFDELYDNMADAISKIGGRPH